MKVRRGIIGATHEAFWRRVALSTGCEQFVLNNATNFVGLLGEVRGSVVNCSLYAAFLLISYDSETL